jgi:hypothetical protein
MRLSVPSPTGTTVSDLSALAVGDPLVVHDSQGSYRHRKVARVGRVWLADDQGSKFRIKDGSGEDRLQSGRGFCALTVAEWEVAEETARLRLRLAEWGWAPASRGKTLALSQLRRAAALLSEFESENNGGRL